MHQYVLGATHLESSLAERALGVLVDKWRIVARRSKVILPFCLALVRPHVECCAHFWAPLYKRGMDTLDILQQRAMNVFKELEHLT